MDKCREALEAQFANSPELRDGHITWWDESNSYIAKTEAFQESADYWNKILNAWRLRQPDIDLLEAKVEELQTQLSLQRQRVKAFEEELTSSRNYGDELQKRVDAVEQVITKIRNGNYASDQGEAVAKFIAGMLEQALKGES
ncbi:hypothetical protein [Acinetobacter nosocomialis]|uniref:hypothetical protein n=1 Tax=Acinetobacter nosocomialis TaxID=106654 RepID=UPI001B8166C5|nr:hypothetical protein [Acinetobacter nosocomialis]MBR7715580.1 hypothetical protein [Acinetobacter nosocomialis]